MSTIGQSDPFNQREPIMAKSKKQRAIFVPFEPLKKEYDIIKDELAIVIAEVQRVAATYGNLPLPLPHVLDEPKDDVNNANRAIYAALLKLDQTKYEITFPQWEDYARRYDDLIDEHGGHVTNREAQRLINFKDEMSEAIDSICDYILVYDIPFKKAHFNRKPSPRAIAVVAIYHAVEWLRQKKKEESQNDLTSQ